MIAEKSVSLSNFNRVYKYFDVNELKVTPSVDGSVDFSVNGNGDIEFKILDGDSVVASSRAQSATATLTVEKPHLWNARLDPYLYTATATLYDGDEAVDEVSCKFAFREYKIDPEKGFILNGKPYPLRGVSRHQDRPGIGNALEYKHHKEDVDLICEMGANTVRLAHYQHNRAFYDLCDERGLVVWAEIPYISRHMPNGVENTLSQMSELVSQNYNHPSIVVWGLSNEITMGGAADKSLIENHHMLNDLCHALDKQDPQHRRLSQCATRARNMCIFLMSCHTITISDGTAALSICMADGLTIFIKISKQGNRHQRVRLRGTQLAQRKACSGRLYRGISGLLSRRAYQANCRSSISLGNPCLEYV